MTPEAPAAAPAASAPASSPAPSSAPAPAAAPSSAPAASASAPAGGASPVAAAPAEIKRADFQTQDAYAQALLKQELAGIPAEGDTPAPDPAAASAAAPVVEEPKTEDAATDVKPEDAAAKPAEDEYTFDLDEPAPAVDPEQLSRLAEEKPEFKQLLEADPELKTLLYSNAREAAEAKQFREFFPDVQSAKFAHENATTFIDVRDTFLGSTTTEGTKATLAKMAQLAIERDEQGNPIIDPITNQPKIGDDFYGFMDNTRDLNMQYDREELQARLTANQYPNDEARERDQIAAAAFDVLKDYYAPEQNAGTQNLPQELQQQKEALDRREREMNDRARNEKVTERQQFEKTLITESTTRVETAINRIIDSVVKQGATLAPFLREALPQKIGSELMKVVAKDPKLKADMAELQRMPMTAEVKSRAADAQPGRQTQEN
jgi:hypothetical protein